MKELASAHVVAALSGTSSQQKWSARPPGVLWPLRRTVHRTRVIALLKKSIFNFGIDAMEPLLGPRRSFLISGGLCLQLRNPIFGRTQLIRKLLRHTASACRLFSSATPAALCTICRIVLAGLVELVTAVLSCFFQPAQTGSLPTRSCHQRFDHASLCPPSGPSISCCRSSV